MTQEEERLVDIEKNRIAELASVRVLVAKHAKRTYLVSSITILVLVCVSILEAVEWYTASQVSTAASSVAKQVAINGKLIGDAQSRIMALEAELKTLPNLNQDMLAVVHTPYLLRSECVPCHTDGWRVLQQALIASKKK